MQDQIPVFLPALIGAVTALTVTWLKELISRYFKGRDTRIAARNLDFETLRTVVFETRDLAAEYWQLPGEAAGQQAVQASIMGRLTFIAKVQSDLFRDDVKSSRDVGLDVHRFHDACSGGTFGSKDRPPDPRRCTDIEVAAYTLIHRCQSALRKLNR